jgi:integrase
MTRGHNEGTISKRKDGRWQARVTLPDGTRRAFYAKTRTEAAAQLHNARQALQQALPVTGGRETVAQFLTRWLRDVVEQRVAWSTAERYRRDIRLHIAKKLGKLRLTELSPKRVQSFINELTAEGLGPRGVAHSRAVLRNALEQALREGLISLNGARHVTIPRQKRKQVAALSPAAAQAIIDTFKGHDYEALITVTIATGLRQGELLGIRWLDLDLDAATVTVHQQLQQVRGEYQLVPLKTDQSRRILPLPRIAVEALRAHRARQAETRLSLGQLWLDRGLVFTTAIGDYLNGSTVTHRFQKRLRAGGLPAMAFHDLRHGTASLLLAQGASMRVVMEQLGHSQISLTMNTYAHIAPALLKDAADRLDRALGGTS